MPAQSRLLTAGIVTLLVGLLAFFPARVAYRWFAPDVITLSGIDGSVWGGTAREASASGVYVRDVRWRFKPLSVFTGKLAYAIEASPSSGFVDGNIAVGLTGTVTMSDVKGSMPIKALQRAVAIPGISGEVNLQFERLQLADGLPVAADGSLEVANLVAPLVHSGSIGGYRAEFFTQESGVMASVEDTDGVVDLAGSLQISKDRSYQFIAQLAAKSNTPANVRQQMQFLGSANERGQHELRLEGKL